jgi:hypothetical protein
MLIAAELLLMALCAALWAPDTPIGKSLRVVLIDPLAKTLSRGTPLKVIVGLIVFLALVVSIIGAPELVAIMGVTDLYFYLDVTIISILMSTAVRLKSMLTYAIRLVRGIAARDIPQWTRAGPRNRLSHRRRPKSPGSRRSRRRREQLRHHRVDLGLGQHEVANDIAPSPILWKASQPPRANSGFSSTPSSVALMSVRGSAIR